MPHVARGQRATRDQACAVDSGKGWSGCQELYRWYVGLSREVQGWWTGRLLPGCTSRAQARYGKGALQGERETRCLRPLLTLWLPVPMLHGAGPWSRPVFCVPVVPAPGGEPGKWRVRVGVGNVMEVWAALLRYARGSRRCCWPASGLPSTRYYRPRRKGGPGPLHVAGHPQVFRPR